MVIKNYIKIVTLKKGHPVIWKVSWWESFAWLWIDNSWSDDHSTLQFTKALINVEKVHT